MRLILLVEESGATQISSIGIKFVDRGAVQTIFGLREVTFEFGVVDWPSGIERGDIILGGGFVVTAFVVGYRENLFGIVGRGVGEELAQGFGTLYQAIIAGIAFDEVSGIFHTLFIGGFGIYVGVAIEFSHTSFPRIEMGEEGCCTSFGSVLLARNTCSSYIAELREVGKHIVGLLSVSDASFEHFLLRGKVVDTNFFGIDGHNGLSVGACELEVTKSEGEVCLTRVIVVAVLGESFGGTDVFEQKV